MECWYRRCFAYRLVLDSEDPSAKGPDLDLPGVPSP
jgi:hypothetical protein